MNITTAHHHLSIFFGYFFIKRIQYITVILTLLYSIYVILLSKIIIGPTNI